MSGNSKRQWKKWLLISLGVTILVVWVAYATVFFTRLNRGGGDTLTPEVQKLATKEIQEEWFALYQHGNRIGYSRSELRPQSGGYMVNEEIFLRLDFLGQVQDISSWVQANLEPDFSLKSFTFRLQAGPIYYRLQGGVEKGSLILVSRMAGQEQIQKLPLSHPIYLSSGMKSFISQQPLAVGNAYRLALFDPATMSQTMVPLQVEEKETVRIGSRDLEAYRVVMNFRGVQLKSWVSPYGELLKEEGFLGLTMVRSDREDALKGFAEAKGAELVREAAVVPDRTIAHPRKLKLLRLQLEGITDDGWELAGGRQNWSNGELAVERESLIAISSAKIPVDNPALARDLQPSLLVQSDAVTLKKQAFAIIGEERNGLQAVRMISSWVYQNLEKRPTLSIPNALAVYEMRAGDCNEHSVLFAALARAVGIPTRIAAGLLYTEGRFYYHAWNEVYLGEWIAVDPLMNQVPADPTHVRLVTGELDRQVELVRVLGRLSIKVLNYE
ncbi:MAG: transglutaminase-like domain-containing protein [Deltaproteobacteria bacterium]|nr:transglutaminase-like domain-containing protein [Deltaproteobacteria bacterium]